MPPSRILQHAGSDAKPLTVSHAFHSPLMQPVMDELRRFATAIPARAPQLAWISTASGAELREPPDARYWCDHALQPVRFRQGIQALAEMGVTDFIEVGPGNALRVLGRQSLDGPHAWLGSLGDKRRSDLSEILASVGELYIRGYELDWDGFNAAHPRRRISLPTYPFERQRYWLENDTGTQSRGSASNGVSLTGQRLRSALPETQFEAVYSLSRFEYLGDHRIYGMPVLPLTAGLTALSDAARQHFGTDHVALANLQYREALVLPEAGERVVQSIFTPVDDATVEFRLASIGADAAEGWRTHMVGMARAEALEQHHATGAAALDRIKLRCPGSIAPELYYRIAASDRSPVRAGVPRDRGDLARS